jgi:Mg2+-importing ATPase
MTFALPFLPSVGIIGFVPLSWPLVATISAITLLYVVATEVGKQWFYRTAG